MENGQMLARPSLARSSALALALVASLTVGALAVGPSDTPLKEEALYKAGVAAIDSVFTAFRDDKGLAAECAAARRDGFTAKMAIHPAQVPVINAAFTPTAEAVERARRIVALFEATPDAGVIGLDGEMLDRPHLLRARRLLDRAG
jgi:citrate lyase beta subunit